VRSLPTLVRADAGRSESICSEVWAMRDGHLEASGHKDVYNFAAPADAPQLGRGPGLRHPDRQAHRRGGGAIRRHGVRRGLWSLTPDAGRSNKIDAVKRAKKLTSAEARKAKKDRMARRKRGEEVLTDEEL
jgi:elongation factor 3